MIASSSDVEARRAAKPAPCAEIVPHQGRDVCALHKKTGTDALGCASALGEPKSEQERLGHLVGSGCDLCRSVRGTWCRERPLVAASGCVVDDS